jgi:hypothetical protein
MTNFLMPTQNTDQSASLDTLPYPLHIKEHSYQIGHSALGIETCIN